MSFVFYSTAVGLAWKGVGALSFAIAMFARSLTGAILVNRASPWRIRWRWDWERASVHLKFGVPYQGVGFISLLKESITPVFIGLLLGAVSVGYINWAQMVAAYPVLALRSCSGFIFRRSPGCNFTVNPYLNSWNKFFGQPMDS